MHGETMQFEFEFADAKETSANRFCDLGLMPVNPQTQHLPTAVKKCHCYTKNPATGVADESGELLRVWQTASTC